MTFLSRMSPVRAWSDLRYFLTTRERHEWWFLVAAIAVTLFLIYAFAKDSYMEKEYKPQIVYVQQWRLDRTDAQIVAQQKIDQVKKDAELAELKKRQDATRASFKRLDDKLTKMGI
ncbi:MAG: hypothetical protein PGN23_02245 [Sphingomonas adhaesiva]|uniref:hypothetical protein n=1 Tax=Sphingomonas adhaesiva TaxID=28212 RepID=UPI002FF4FD33